MAPKAPERGEAVLRCGHVRVSPISSINGPHPVDPAAFGEPRADRLDHLVEDAERNRRVLIGWGRQILPQLRQVHVAEIR